MSEMVERVSLAICNAIRAEHDLPPIAFAILDRGGHVSFLAGDNELARIVEGWRTKDRLIAQLQIDITRFRTVIGKIMSSDPAGWSRQWLIEDYHFTDEEVDWLLATVNDIRATSDPSDLDLPERE